MDLLKEWTLRASGAVTPSSPNGAAVNINLGWDVQTSSGWTLSAGRLLVPITAVTATGTLVGTLQGLVPGAASTSTTATDWYDILTLDLQSATGTPNVIVGPDQPFPIEWVRFQPTVANASVTFAAYLIARYARR